MNENHPGWGTKTVRVRAWSAGLGLLAAGCMLLGWSSRSGSPRQHAAQTPPGPAALGPDFGSLSSQRARVLASFDRLPLIFEPNVGQTDPSVRFLSHGNGYTLFLGDNGATLSLRAQDSANASRNAVVRMRLAGASPEVPVSGDGLLPGITNYFLGNDPAKWHTNIPQFARVRYENAYPGISLVFYGNQGRLEYDFQVAPGADPSRAELQVDDASRLELTGDDLTIESEGGSIRLAAPQIYQNVDGRQQAVEGRFALRSPHRVGFEIGTYDRSRELIIDPVLTYSTFFGGTGNESCPSFVAAVPVTPGCPAIAVDSAGDIFLAGATTSPTNSFPQPAQGTSLLTGSTKANIYVAEINSTGQNVLSLTFLGGGGLDVPSGLAVDAGGNAYLAGTTTSGIGGTAPFPTTITPYQAGPETGSTGTSHVFVTKLNGGSSTVAAQLLYSTYLSGNGTDIASGMTIDNSGDVYVTGTTTSTDTPISGDPSLQFPASSLPQAPTFQAFSLAPIQFFVTEVNTGAGGFSSVAYSTYFGGATPTTGTATGGGIAVDSSGVIYFTGTTNFLFTGTSPTTDFPIVNAYQPCLDQIPPTTITFPVTCTYGATPPTATDAFAAKLDPTKKIAGTAQLIWSTYLGGTGNDVGSAIAIDSGAANIYITGTTNSSPFSTITTFAAFQTCLNTPPPNPATCTPPNTNNDAFVARLNNPTPTSNNTTSDVSLTYFSYLGGAANESGLSVAVDTAGDALLTGWTQSTNFPTTAGPIQSALNPTQDAFFAHIDTTTLSGQNQVGAYSTYFGGNGITSGTSITVDSNLNAYFAGSTNSTNLETNSALQLNNAGGFDAYATRLSPASNLAISGVITFGVGQQFAYAGQPITFTYTITNEGPDLATDVVVSDDLSKTGVAVTVQSASTSSGTCSQTTTSAPVVCSIQSLQVGATDTVKVTLVPASTNGTQASFNGGKVSVSSTNNVAQGNSTTVVGDVTDFSVSVTPSSQPILAAGDSANYTVLLTPHPVYGAGITLSVTNLPSASKSAFSSATVTLGTSSPSTSTLTVSTTPRPVTTTALRRGSLYALWLALPGMVFFGWRRGGWAGAAGSNWKRRIAAIWLLVSIMFLLVLLPACGSTRQPTPVSGTPAGTYTMIVTASAGSVSHSQQISITVP